MKLRLPAAYSTGVHHSVVMIVGNTAGTGISALALLLISRILGPSAFGVFGVGFALALILNRINDLGLSYVLQRFIPQADHERAAFRIFSYTLLLKLLGSLLILFLGWPAVPLVGEWLHFSSLAILRLVLVANVVTVVYEQLQTLLQSLQKVPQLVLMNFVQAATKLIGVCFFFWYGVHDVFLVLGWYLFAPLVAVACTPWLLPQWRLIHLWQNFSAERHRISGMIGHAAVAIIAAGLIENIDIVFVQRYLTSYEAGLLAGVSRIAMVFSLIGYSLGSVLNPRVAKYQSRHDLDKYWRKAWGVTGVSLLGFLAFIPFAPLAITLTIGPEYMPGLTTLLVLVGASFLTIAVIPFLALFFSFNAPWYFSVTGVLQVLIIVIGSIVFVPTHGLFASAVTRLVSRLVLYLFTVLVARWWYAHRHAVA